MCLRNSPGRWGRLAQLMHWAVALLILATFPIGWLANSLERGPAARTLFSVHFAIGAVLFLIVVARVAWRLVDAAPKPLPGTGAMAARAAKTVHLLIYAVMVAAMVSGYVIQIHMRPTLDVAGLLQIPRPFTPGEDESLRALAWYVHTYSVWTLLALVSLHASAALWHHFILRDPTLLRMVPTFRGARKVREWRADCEQAMQEQLDGAAVRRDHPAEGQRCTGETS